MPDHAIQSRDIKLLILERFYGLEEYLDLPEALPDMLAELDKATSEFCLMTALSDLDVWYVRITNHHDSKIWNPFIEPLAKYAKRYDLLTAHLFPEKQWPNHKILKFLNVPVLQ